MHWLEKINHPIAPGSAGIFHSGGLVYLLVILISLTAMYFTNRNTELWSLLWQ